jgi:hypothetical protein
MVTMLAPMQSVNQGPSDHGTASTTRKARFSVRLGQVQTSEGAGSYIQAWRHRLQPADAGLPAGSSRRTRGLRREELASLAGISVDYLVRLEQGRATNPQRRC